MQKLINKSNQFNLTTRRRHEPEVAAIEGSPDHFGLQFRLTDTFGDNGMISVVVLEKDGHSMIIDTWLMSCRVLERGVEKAVLNEIIRIAKIVGVQRVIGEFIPSPRNEMVRDHYQRLGFSPVTGDENRFLWEMATATYDPLAVQIVVDRTSVHQVVELKAHRFAR